MAVCYHLRYSSTSCSIPVREIQEFEGPEASQANAMADDGDPGAGGGTNPPVSLQRSYPERFQNLSLIDSISYLLLVTELDKDVVQSYLATLATPNQLIQLTMCCSQAQLETAARPASKAAARRVWTTAE